MSSSGGCLLELAAAFGSDKSGHQESSEHNVLSVITAMQACHCAAMRIVRDFCEVNLSTGCMCGQALVLRDHPGLLQLCGSMHWDFLRHAPAQQQCVVVWLPCSSAAASCIARLMVVVGAGVQSML